MGVALLVSGVEMKTMLDLYVSSARVLGVDPAYFLALLKSL